MVALKEAITKYNGTGTKPHLATMTLDLPFPVKAEASPWKGLMEISGTIEEVPGVIIVDGNLVINFESEDAQNNTVNKAKLSPPRNRYGSIQSGIPTGASYGKYGAGVGYGGIAAGQYRFSLTGAGGYGVPNR